MPRVCWEEQLGVSCAFVTINSRSTEFFAERSPSYSWLRASRNKSSASLKTAELFLFSILAINVDSVHGTDTTDHRHRVTLTPAWLFIEAYAQSGFCYYLMSEKRVGRMDAAQTRIANQSFITS